MYKLLLLLLSAFLSAQNYRFVYEYKMKPDTEKDSLVTDYMNLDSDGKKSYFYNAVKFEKDSVYQADKDPSVLFKSKSYDRNLSYIVEKDYSGKTLNLYDKFKNVHLVVEEQEMPQWKIQKDFSEINGMNCQKAVATYKGREWEAWFSKDYPVSDGPYKFSGLPGLVVKVKDGDGEHIFNLIQVKKIRSLFSFVPKNSKKMSGEAYRKLLKNDVFSSEDIESLNVDSKQGKMGIQLKDGYVAQLDMNELKRAGKGNTDAEMAKRLRRTNNPIEKDREK